MRRDAIAFYAAVFTAGAATGLMEVPLANPLEVWRTRLMTRSEGCRRLTSAADVSGEEFAVRFKWSAFK